MRRRRMTCTLLSLILCVMLVVLYEGSSRPFKSSDNAEEQGPTHGVQPSLRIETSGGKDEGSSRHLKYSDNAEEQAGFFSITSPSSYPYCIIVGLVGGIAAGLVLIVVLFIVWKCKKTKIKDQRRKQSTKTQEELDAWREVLSPLMELKTGVENQRETFRLQLEEIENEREENKKKLQSVEKEISESEKEKATDRTEGYLREKQSLLNAQWKLEKRKEEVEKQQLNMEKLLQKTEGMNVTMTDRKRKVENQMEVIKSFLGELDSNDENTPLLMV